MLIPSYLQLEPSNSRTRVPAGGINLIASIDFKSDESTTVTLSSSTKVSQGEDAISRAQVATPNHSNQQFSIYAITDVAASIVARYAYTAYGQPTILNAAATVIATSAISNRYTYTAREWDATVGLYHFRARWMSGLTGRFLSRDPIDYEGSEWSPYEFCKARATMDLDPSGLDTIVRPPIKRPKPKPGKGWNERRTFGMGYLWCDCQKKADRLSPVPGISNPSSPPIAGTGPGAGENEVHPFPSSPPTAVGTGGAGSCVALIVKCPGFVAVYHFTGGDDPSATIRRLNWPSGCDAMICGGDPREPQSDCLGEEVANVAKGKFNLVGISGNSGCGVDENGNFYQYGN